MNVNKYGLKNDELLIVGGLATLLYIWWKGGVSGAASAAGKALVNVASGMTSGAVDTIGQGVGLPSLADITTDPSVARYLIDNPNGGLFFASEWASAAAFFKATAMPSGSGTPPPAGSKVASLLAPQNGSMPIAQAQPLPDLGSVPQGGQSTDPGYTINAPGSVSASWGAPSSTSGMNDHFDPMGNYIGTW